MDAMLRSYHLTIEAVHDAMSQLNNRAQTLKGKGESAGAVTTSELAAWVLAVMVIATVGYLAFKAYVNSLTNDLQNTPRPGQQ